MIVMAAVVVVVVVGVVVVGGGGDDGGCSYWCILSGCPCVRVRLTSAHILLVVHLKFLNSC
jgi:hypothetical protein